MGRLCVMEKASGVVKVPFRGDTWDPTVKNRGKKGPFFRIEFIIRETGVGFPPNLYCPEGAARRPQTLGLKRWNVRTLRNSFTPCSGRHNVNAAWGLNGPSIATNLCSSAPCPCHPDNGRGAQWIDLQRFPFTYV